MESQSRVGRAGATRGGCWPEPPWGVTFAPPEEAMSPADDKRAREGQTPRIPASLKVTTADGGAGAYGTSGSGGAILASLPHLACVRVIYLALTTLVMRADSRYSPDTCAYVCKYTPKTCVRSRTITHQQETQRRIQYNKRQYSLSFFKISLSVCLCVSLYYMINRSPAVYTYQYQPCVIKKPTQGKYTTFSYTKHVDTSIQ